MSDPPFLDLEGFYGVCHELCRTAGSRILDCWKKAQRVEHKPDDSPVTQADRDSHEILSRGLEKAYPGLPLISEEGREVPYHRRGAWRRLLLLDPLDGTREYLAGRDEFVISIGLVEDGKPVYGVLYAPARGDFYHGGPGRGAFRESGGRLAPIRTAREPQGAPLVLHSRSHKTPRLDEWLKGMAHTRMAVGSGLKFCLLAEGQGQLYPCLHPTYEWDTAAGQAIVEAAGGTVLDLEGRPLRYNKESLLNPLFVARA